MGCNCAGLIKAMATFESYRNLQTLTPESLWHPSRVKPFWLLRILRERKRVWEILVSLILGWDGEGSWQLGVFCKLGPFGSVTVQHTV